MTDTESRLDRKVEYGILSSFYGALLTERQRTMLNLYCDEDLSLVEVAQHLGVTRQCVSDTLQRAFKRLDDLEGSMRLFVKFDRQREIMAACHNLIEKSLKGIDVSRNLESAARQLADFLREEDV